MKEIKTKAIIKDIRALDKAADVTRRAKNTYIRTKEQAEQTQQTGHGNFVEYARDTIKEATKIVARETGHAAERQAKKAVQNIKERRVANTDAFKKNTSKQASKTGTGSEAEHKATPSETHLAGDQRASQPQTMRQAQMKATQSKTREAIKRKYTLARPSKFAKRRFVQGREKARFSLNREMQAAETNSLNVSATGRTVKQSVRPSGKTVKEAAKGAIKLTQRSVKTAGHTAKATVKTSQSAKTAAKTAQATHRAAQTARAAARSGTLLANRAAKAMAAAIKAIIAAVKGLTALVAAGGLMALVIILVICLAGLLSGSVFGVFFSNESYNTNTPIMTEIISQVNEEFAAEIQRIQDENPHDTLELTSSGSGIAVGNWRDILGVYAVKVSADPKNSMEVVTLDDVKVEILRDVFWDMNKIDYWLETVGDEESSTTVLHINVASKSYADMITEYGFKAQQAKILNELMQEEYQLLFVRLIGS